MIQHHSEVRCALLAVSDKSNIVELAHGLSDLGWKLIATSGTASMLIREGIPITLVADVTGIPEMLSGRVKTFHYKIFGGLLYRRDDSVHKSEAIEYDIPAIGLIACNFYPFETTTSQEDLDLSKAQDLIDIGGPSLVRAGAKNFEWVIPLVDPQDYASVLNQLKGKDGDPNGVSIDIRRALAVKAFQYTATYDTVITKYLSK